jgi:hypothetical protein
MKRTLAFWICTLACLAARLAHAQHAGDVAVTVMDGVLRTNAFDDQGAMRPARLFTATLGDTGVPEFTADPGYEAAAGTFPTGTRIGWKAMSGLRRWNGASFEPTDARMQFRYLTASFTVSSTAVTGFTLIVQSDGGLHRHLNMTLSMADASTPPAGAYLAEMQLFTTSPAMSGETYWLLFNQSLSEEAFAAIATEARDQLEGAPCAEDIDGNGEVDTGDVAFALLDFGPCPGCPADLDGSGEVDFGDVALILLSTGPCP